MLRDCCDKKSHWLRDERDKRVDMLQYVDTLSELFHKAVKLPPNFTFASYTEIFAGNKINVSVLSDHIHLKKDAQKIVAAYCLQ